MNATALRNTKSQTYLSKCIYRMSKHSKTAAACTPTSSVRNLRILTKLIAGSTPPLCNLKSPLCQPNSAAATWFLWPLKSRPLQMRDPRHDCCTLQAIDQKYFTAHKGHKKAIAEIHDCSKIPACEMRRMSYFSRLGQREASQTSHTTTRVAVVAGPELSTRSGLPR